MTRIAAFALVSGLCVLAEGYAYAQQAPMSFFVTSVGLGKGGDLGGLAGADRHCQSLAQAVGAGSKTWRAYLSTQGSGGVSAKDRIGNGPWFNAKGVQVAANLTDLHSDKNKINKETALNEKGMVVNGHGDTPNQHDMLTGTQQNGTAGSRRCNLQQLDVERCQWPCSRPIIFSAFAAGEPFRRAAYARAATRRWAHCAAGSAPAWQQSMLRASAVTSSHWWSSQ